MPHTTIAILVFSPLLLVWLFLIFKLDWSKIKVSRLMLLGFIAVFLASIPAIYAPIQEYQEGVNYFQHHHRSIWGVSGYYLSGCLSFLGFWFFMSGIVFRSRKKLYSQIKQNNLSSSKKLLLAILLSLCLALVILLAFASFFQLFMLFAIFIFVILNSYTGGYIIPSIIGTLIIFLAPGATIDQRRLMFLVLLFHLSILWTYSQLLPLEEQSSFNAGFAKAVQTNVDTESIHQWMAAQDCSSANDSSFEIRTDYDDYDPEKFNQLPASIRNTKPTIISFSCRGNTGPRLTLVFPYWGDPWGLTFVHPPVSSDALRGIVKRKREYGTPISGDCSCYIWYQ